MLQLTINDYFDVLFQYKESETRLKEDLYIFIYKTIYIFLKKYFRSEDLVLKGVILLFHLVRQRIEMSHMSLQK